MSEWKMQVYNTCNILVNNYCSPNSRLRCKYSTHWYYDTTDTFVIECPNVLYLISPGSQPI